MKYLYDERHFTIELIELFLLNFFSYSAFIKLRDGYINCQKNIIEVSNQRYKLTDLNNQVDEYKDKVKNYDIKQLKEQIELLKQADIVVTNPPFSLFREYVAQLIKYDKKFLIIGNVNSNTTKEIFPLFKDNKIWMGASIHSGDREFRVPKSYPLNASGTRIDEKGNKYIRVKGVRWYTNLDFNERHDTLDLYKEYNEEF